MAENAIALSQDPAAVPPLIAPDKEIDLLIKSIEEASKHTKDTLLVLLAASFYILVAVFSASSKDAVQLPLLSVSVSNNVFLALSPLLVISPYLYLQLCLSDLRVRIRAFLAMNLVVKYVPESGLLLFPFLVTRGLFGHEKRLIEAAKPRDFRSTYVWTVTVLLVWVVAPAILLTLWLRFIDKQQIQSLIPGIALIATMYGSSFGRPPSRFRNVFSAASSILLLLISVASVAQFRHTTELASVWSFAQRVGNRIVANSHRAFYFNAPLIGLLIGFVALVGTIEDSITEMALKILQSYFEKIWIEIQDRSGIVFRVASRLLYFAVSSRKPLRSLAVMISIVISAVSIFISLLI